MAQERKKGFCETNKCILVLLVIVVVFIVLTSLVTFVDKDLRKLVTYHSSDKLEWWQTSIVYQVYPRSFQDSNGDGTGDLKGVTRRLGYLYDLGVGAIWLSPFYKSPMRDFGYDVENHTAVDPLFGTMQHFDELVKEAKKYGLKVIIDFVPNHTSNESIWFQESCNGNAKYKDYYIWNDGIDCPTCANTNFRKPPNDWESAFRGSAWTYNDKRKQFYYHAYLDSQPDLNVRNPVVQQELLAILRFWLNKGVDGFRGDAVRKLFEVSDVSLNEYGIRNLTRNLADVYPILRQWKQVLDEYTREDGKSRVLIPESYGITNDMRNEYYKAGTMPFNFAFIKDLKPSCTAKCIKEIIDFSLKDMQEEWWPNFVLGSHDVSRIADRMGQELVDVFNMLLLTLPGTPTTYYGEEIGMRDTFYTYQESRDPAGLNYKENFTLHSRDPERSPMQWDSNLNAGFSTGKPWLHVNRNYQRVNVKDQNNTESSHYKIYQRLAKLRQDLSFTNKNLKYSQINKNIISYLRSTVGESQYLVVMNFGWEESSVDCSGEPTPSRTAEVVVNTGNFNTDMYREGKIIDIRNIKLQRGQGIVLKVYNSS